MSLAGELIYVRWPHAEGEAGKPIPALVLEGPDAQGDLVLMKVTGQTQYTGAVPIRSEDLDLLQSAWNRRAACQVCFQQCSNPEGLEMMAPVLQGHILPVAEGFNPDYRLRRESTIECQQ